MRPQESRNTGWTDKLRGLLGPKSSVEAMRQSSSPIEVARHGRHRVAPLAALALAGIVGMAPGKAKADGLTVECDTPTAVTSVGSGEVDFLHTPQGYLLNENPIWDLQSSMYYGSTSYPVTVTDYYGIADYSSANFERLSEVDGILYGQDGLDSLEMTCSGTSCTAIDIGVPTVEGFTYHDGTYLYSKTGLSGNDEIFDDAGSSVYSEYSDDTGTYDWNGPDSCASVDATGSRYLAAEEDRGTLGSDALVIIDTDTGDYGYATFGGTRFMCEENADGTLTIRTTIADGSGGYPVYETTCTVTADAVDADSDGVAADDDCDDDDSAVGAASAHVTDADGDGFHAEGTEADVCPADATATQILATSSSGVDCDDSASSITVEVEYAYDGDGDSYYASGSESNYCPADAPSGYIATSGSAVDCNDSAAAINPGATEIPYNGLDDDCDTSTPDDDLDGDGLVYAYDCNDGSAAVGLPVPYEADGDGDGFSDPSNSETACPGEQSEGYIEPTEEDCDDNDTNTYPGAPEQCDGVDNDCDTVVDNDVTYTNWYVDNDGDGYGAGTARNDCLAESNEVSNNADCDDTDATVNPNAREIPDDIDNDCDGDIDSEDDNLVMISTDCDQVDASMLYIMASDAENSGGYYKVSMLPMDPAKADGYACSVWLEGACTDAGECAQVDLAEGAGVDIIFADGENGDPNTYILLADPETNPVLAVDSYHQDQADILQGAVGANHLIAGLAGTKTTMTAESFTETLGGEERQCVEFQVAVDEPTVNAQYYPGSDDEFLNLGTLETRYAMTEAGLTMIATETSDRGESFIQLEVVDADGETVHEEILAGEDLVDDNTDDTGTPETDDTGTPNTERPGDDPEGCNCSTVEGQTRGKLAAVLGGILGLAALRRRRD